MNKLTLLLLSAIFCLAAHKEIAVSVSVPDREAMLRTVDAGLMLDDYNRETGIVRGVIDEGDLPTLRALGYPVEILPETDARRLADTAKEPSGYPLHWEYLNYMDSIANTHPVIAKLDTFGYSVDGLPLLMMKLSNRVAWDETEPEFCYISTMHGDEPVGFIFLMWFIDSLVSNYGSDPRITRIIDSCEIFINPLLNPDGYIDKKRRNTNNVDLNRDYPVPDGVIGQDIDYAIEPETEAVMDWFPQHNISYTINFHGGALVANYPWDYTPARSPDDSLYKFIAINYSSRNPPMYASPFFDNGITNGYDWYEVDGSTQDWTYWTNGDLHLTVELYNTKTPSYSSLPTIWESNYDAFLAAIEVTLNHGVHGIVTDSTTGESLGVLISLDDPDKDAFSDPVNGYYHRILLPGSYNLTFSKHGYHSKTLPVTIPDTGLVRLDVQLSQRKLGYVYQSDFEADDGGLSTDTFDFNQDWEYGVPSAGIIGAHSGEKLWGTQLAGQYRSSSQSRLILEDIVLPNIDSLTLSFWQWFSFEEPTYTRGDSIWYDGGNVKLWTTSGDSVILTLDPDYDTTLNAGNLFIANQRGYAGPSGGKWWHEVTADLTPWRGQTVTISWDFGSDNSAQAAGWHIDDIAIFYADTTMSIVNSHHRLPEATNITISPNPFNSVVTILLVGATHTSPLPSNIEIYDINGRNVANIPLQVVHERPVGQFTNRPYKITWQPDDDTPSGVYLVRAKIEDEQLTKKIVYLR